MKQPPIKMCIRDRSVTNPGGGESRNVAGLEFDVMSNGKPTFTPAAGA